MCNLRFVCGPVCGLPHFLRSEFIHSQNENNLNFQTFPPLVVHIKNSMQQIKGKAFATPPSLLTNHFYVFVFGPYAVESERVSSALFARLT
jgi:hypothetical protein